MMINTFPALLQSFFTDRLLQQWRASAHTVASYRDAFRLLLRFASEKLGKKPSILSMKDLTPDFISSFLEYVEKGLNNLDLDKLDLVIIENVGNLVCPAEFDTGAIKNVMILSIPEGDDKPLKYPLMFSVCDVLLVNKMDYLPLSDFDVKAMRERVLNLNPQIEIQEVDRHINDSGFAEIAATLMDNMIQK